MINNDHDFGEEYCPNCGNWLPLVDETGWCVKCTSAHYPDRPICIKCNQPFKQTDTQVRKTCNKCKYTSLDDEEATADKIELYLAAGLTFPLAVARVKFDNLPICNCCGKKIKGGTPGRHIFCRTNPQCRKAARSYKWFKESKNMTREDAIKKVIEKLKEVRV